jgi:hypothetical protein
MFVGVSGSIHIRGRVVCEQDSQDRKGDETIKLDDAESESAPVHTSRSDVDLSQLPDSEVTLQWLEDQLRRQAISSNVSLDRCRSCRRREARVERAGRESHHVCTGFETGGVDSWMGGRVKGRGSVEDVGAVVRGAPRQHVRRSKHVGFGRHRSTMVRIRKALGGLCTENHHYVLQQEVREHVDVSYHGYLRATRNIRSGRSACCDR